MVNNNGDAKAKFTKSARRRPLRDVSNGSLKSSKKKKINLKLKSKEEQLSHSQTQHSNNEDPLDRLLLLHSDISSLLSQIDELVVQAVNVDTTDNERISEIKSFTTELSGIHTSLKLWVPRLQKALAVPHSKSEIQFCEPCIGAPSVADQSDGHTVDTPEPTKHEPLVSPSPLVSWRAINCAEERGKQLFFLTPLLRPKTTTSKVLALPKLTTYEGITSRPAATFPSLSADDESNNEKLKVVSKNIESMSDMGFVSALEVPVRDFSTALFTPYHKNPPPRTHVMHEPCHEISHRTITKSHKSTPFPNVNNNFVESTESESSSGEVSAKLGLRYPELNGIIPSCRSKNGTRALEASPAWMKSPPKCCRLLEPLDEKHPEGDASLQDLACTFNQQLCLASKDINIHDGNNQDEENKQICLQGNTRSNFAMVESTPLWKGPESTIRRGKRPGENTLKRELWTRFEAATTDECHLNFSIVKDTSQRGFLERLEEASFDESLVHTDVIR